MSSINKLSSLAWAVVVSLGIVCSSGVVYADTVTNPDFVSGNTLNADHMNNIKSAVNSLYTGIGACAGNPAVAGDTMVRVGSVCVDKYEAKIVGSVAQSVAGDTPTISVNWITAARACAKAGKRLLTNAEWQVAATGTPAGSCNIPGAGGTLAANNANPACVSTDLVVNMVGNAVEWVADWSGLATSTTVLSAAVGVLRGGDATDATATVEWLRTGIALNSTDPLRGFRCAR